jgi:hypothetical protein
MKRYGTIALRQLKGQRENDGNIIINKTKKVILSKVEG